MMAADEEDAAAADHYSTEGERLGEEHKLLTSPPYGRVLLARAAPTGFAERWPRASRAWKRPRSCAAPPPTRSSSPTRCSGWPRHAISPARRTRPASARRGAARPRAAPRARHPRRALGGHRAPAQRQTARRRFGGARGGGRAERPRARRPEDAPDSAVGGQIGQELFISYHTVHSHVRTIYRKLGTSSRAQTVERARATGLLRAPLGRSMDGAGG